MIDHNEFHHISTWRPDGTRFSPKPYTSPDRIGFFTPGGPPPKQVSEVECFIRILAWQSLFVLLYPIYILISDFGIILRCLRGLGFLLAVQFAMSCLVWTAASYCHRHDSRDWGTWQYRDDETAQIHYGRELFECFWDGWKYLLLEIFLRLDGGLGGFLTDCTVYVLFSVFLCCANRPGSKDWGACQHRGDASHTHSWKELFHCYCSGLDYGLLFASWLGYAIGYWIDWSYVKAIVNEAWKMLRGCW
ncbi:unnamed protein product [Fusarium graminearum]|nr:unnamed protein product [Fusarium graminearum]